MSPEQIVTIAVAILQTGGLVYFFNQVVNGLKEKIAALEQTIAAQNKTLEIMERQVAETEKVGLIYKSLFSELPKDLDNYKAVISKTKDDVILELKNANKEKEERLKQLAETERKLTETPTSNRAAVKHLETMRFLLSKEREHFKSFVEKICGDIDVAVSLLSSAKDFEAFLKVSGKSIVIEDNKESWDELIKNSNKDGAPRMSQGQWSQHGWWGLFDNEKIIMNTHERNHVAAAIHALSIKLAGLS